MRSTSVLVALFTSIILFLMFFSLANVIVDYLFPIGSLNPYLPETLRTNSPKEQQVSNLTSKEPQRSVTSNTLNSYYTEERTTTTSTISPQAVITITIGPNFTSKSDPEKLLLNTIEEYLNDPNEIAFLSQLALRLKGSTIEESVWNILEWEEKSIKYDTSALFTVKLPFYSRYVQKPSETVNRGTGICTDYTVLTSGLLLSMGYSLVYIFLISFANETEQHMAAAVKINNEYFMLDQHPPAMDLGTYWKFWANSERFKDPFDILGWFVKNRSIDNAKVYEVRKENGRISIRYVETLYSKDFLEHDWSFTHQDLENITKDLTNLIIKNYPNLKLDINIANIDKSIFLPVGYSSGVSWRMYLPFMAEIYNPVFHKQLVSYIYNKLIKDENISQDLIKYNRIWVKSEVSGDSITIFINLATQ